MITNRDVLNRKHPKEIEQMLGYLLIDFWEELRNKKNLLTNEYFSCPINCVSFYKEFLKKETLIETVLYDKIYPEEKTKTEIIDVEYREIKNNNF